MTNENCADHQWRPMDEDEVTQLRSESRRGRPSGAWLEGGRACQRCSTIEAQISWWGQSHFVPVIKDASGTTVRWQDRSQAAGGAPGMGMGQT
jgi:hypothetical protein